MSKKPHWTQTPEGKERMGVIQKLAWAARRKKEKTNTMRDIAKTMTSVAKSSVSEPAPKWKFCPHCGFSLK